MFVVPYTNLATSSLTTATTKRQQSPKGKQFNRAEKESKAERVKRGTGREVAREKRPQGASWTILFCKVAKKCAQREAGEAGTGRGGGTTVKGSVTHR